MKYSERVLYYTHSAKILSRNLSWECKQRKDSKKVKRNRERKRKLRKIADRFIQKDSNLQANEI